MDLSLPEAWGCTASVGWTAMHWVTTGEPAPEPDLVEVQPGVWLASRFSLSVWGQSSAGVSFSVYLMLHAAKETGVRLVAALSIEADLDQPLDILRSHRPIYWWKHKAMVQLADQSSRELIDIVDRVAPEDVPAFEAVALDRLSALQQVSTRRHRSKITGGRLDEVARIYSEAEEKPTLAVAEELHVSHSHAAHLVAQARKAGKLPPANRRKSTS